MLSDRQSLSCAVKRKIVNTPTSEKFPNLYPHRVLNRKNTLFASGVYTWATVIVNVLINSTLECTHTKSEDYGGIFTIKQLCLVIFDRKLMFQLTLITSVIYFNHYYIL